jgi:hypothetical protein
VWLILLAIVAFVVTSGCATYSEKIEEARTLTNQGAYPEATRQMNDFLGVRSSEDLPRKWKGENSLAVLERSILLQAQGDYALSARDMGAADENIEILDLEKDAIGSIGKYVYSDSSANYAPAPTERVALNGLNLANYLAVGDLSGAAVEARRYTNMRDYLKSIEFEATASFGAYLAGFTFERLGEGDRALRYYEEAMKGGTLQSLAGPVARLARSNPYRGPRIEELLAAHPEAATVAPAGEILTIVALGRVPIKMPKRIPIGAAVGIAGTLITGNSAVLERSVFKVVVYPEMEGAKTRAQQASVTIDGAPVTVELASHLGKDIEKEYEKIKPQIIAAALTRMISRALVAEGARYAGRSAGGGLGSILGLAFAWATEASLVALDKPDTRSWTFLPERVYISRMPVDPGEHEVEAVVGGVGETRRIPVQVPKGGFAVLVVTVPR